jgi:hypothetical protein
MRELFWLSDKQLRDLLMAVSAGPARSRKLIALIEREIKARR